MFRRNRYYDAASGRFPQEDPIGLAGGLNSYGFGEGDPVNYSDPYGLFAMESDDDDGPEQIRPPRRSFREAPDPALLAEVLLREIAEVYAIFDYPPDMRGAICYMPVPSTKLIRLGDQLLSPNRCSRCADLEPSCEDHRASSELA